MLQPSFLKTYAGFIMMIDEILSRLEGVRRTGPDKYVACCPAHEDNDPSLGITKVGQGRILLHCFAGCDPVSVLAAIGLSMSDLFEDGPIADNIAGIFPSLAQKKCKKEDEAYHSKIVLDIARAERLKGKKLSKDDMQSELKAYMKLKQIGISTSFLEE